MTTRPRTLVYAALACGSLVAPPWVSLAQQAPSAPPSAPAPAPATPQSQALRALLAGRYVPVPGAPNAANRDAGVQRSVESLIFLLRPIANSRITEANPVFPSITVAFLEGAIEVQSPPLVARSPDDGAEGSMLNVSRERNRLSQRLTGDALVQRMWSDSGSRTTRFVPGGNGRLILQVEITSPRLPVPVRYTMAYQRE